MKLFLTTDHFTLWRKIHWHEILGLLQPLNSLISREGGITYRIIVFGAMIWPYAQPLHHNCLRKQLYTGNMIFPLVDLLFYSAACSWANLSNSDIQEHKGNYLLKVFCYPYESLLISIHCFKTRAGKYLSYLVFQILL